jgi:hypothetical protein
MVPISLQCLLRYCWGADFLIRDRTKRAWEEDTRCARTSVLAMQLFLRTQAPSYSFAILMLCRV